MVKGIRFASCHKGVCNDVLLTGYDASKCSITEKIENDLMRYSTEGI